MIKPNDPSPMMSKINYIILGSHPKQDPQTISILNSIKVLSSIVGVLSYQEKVNKFEIPMIPKKPQGSHFNLLTHSPYESTWASVVLKDQFKVSLKKVHKKSGSKWIVQKVKEEEEKQQLEEHNQKKFLRHQEQLFGNSPSKQRVLNKRLDEYMLDYGKSNVKSDNFKSSNNSSTHGPKRLRQRYVNVDEI